MATPAEIQQEIEQKTAELQQKAQIDSRFSIPEGFESLPMQTQLETLKVIEQRKPVVVVFRERGGAITAGGESLSSNQLADFERRGIKIVKAGLTLAEVARREREAERKLQVAAGERDPGKEEMIELPLTTEQQRAKQRGEEVKPVEVLGVTPAPKKQEPSQPITIGQQTFTFGTPAFFTQKQAELEAKVTPITPTPPQAAQQAQTLFIAGRIPETTAGFITAEEAARRQAQTVTAGLFAPVTTRLTQPTPLPQPTIGFGKIAFTLLMDPASQRGIPGARPVSPLPTLIRTIQRPLEPLATVTRDFRETFTGQPSRAPGETQRLAQQLDVQRRFAVAQPTFGDILLGSSRAPGELARRDQATNIARRFVAPTPQAADVGFIGQARAPGGLTRLQQQIALRQRLAAEERARRSFVSPGLQPIPQPALGQTQRLAQQLDIQRRFVAPTPQPADVGFIGPSRAVGGLTRLQQQRNLTNQIGIVDPFVQPPKAQPIPSPALGQTQRLAQQLDIQRRFAVPTPTPAGVGFIGQARAPGGLTRLQQQIALSQRLAAEERARRSFVSPGLPLIPTPALGQPAREQFVTPTITRPSQTLLSLGPSPALGQAARQEFVPPTIQRPQTPLLDLGPSRPLGETQRLAQQLDVQRRFQIDQVAPAGTLGPSPALGQEARENQFSAIPLRQPTRVDIGNPFAAVAGGVSRGLERDRREVLAQPFFRETFVRGPLRRDPDVQAAVITGVFLGLGSVPVRAAIGSLGRAIGRRAISRTVIVEEGVIVREARRIGQVIKSTAKTTKETGPIKLKRTTRVLGVKVREEAGEATFTSEIIATAAGDFEADIGTTVTFFGRRGKPVQQIVGQFTEIGTFENLVGSSDVRGFTKTVGKGAPRGVRAQRGFTLQTGQPVTQAQIDRGRLTTSTFRGESILDVKEQSPFIIGPPEFRKRALRKLQTSQSISEIETGELVRTEVPQITREMLSRRLGISVTERLPGPLERIPVIGEAAAIERGEATILASETIPGAGTDAFRALTLGGGPPPPGAQQSVAKKLTKRTGISLGDQLGLLQQEQKAAQIAAQQAVPPSPGAFVKLTAEAPVTRPTRPPVVNPFGITRVTQAQLAQFPFVAAPSQVVTTIDLTAPTPIPTTLPTTGAGSFVQATPTRPAVRTGVRARAAVRPRARSALESALGTRTEGEITIKPETRVAQTPVEAQVVGPTIAQTPAVAQVTRQGTLQEQITGQQTIQQLIRVPRTTTRTIQRTGRIPRVPPPPLLPRFRRESFGGAFSTFVPAGGTFIVQIRRKGKFVTVSRPLSRQAALALGTRITSTTLAATFRLVPVSGRPQRAPPSGGPSALSSAFRTFKIVGGKRVPLIDTFIQRRGQRLASPQERRAIQRARSSASSFLQSNSPNPSRSTTSAQSSFLAVGKAVSNSPFLPNKKRRGRNTEAII
jgi:hypothetical protein|tara:strand:+ start:13313 stop:17617 length:4305 start_codon:yes stop_codon:yes gene_type:complete